MIKFSENKRRSGGGELKLPGNPGKQQGLVIWLRLEEEEKTPLRHLKFCSIDGFREPQIQHDI